MDLQKNILNNQLKKNHEECKTCSSTKEYHTCCNLLGKLWTYIPSFHCYYDNSINLSRSQISEFSLKRSSPKMHNTYSSINQYHHLCLLTNINSNKHHYIHSLYVSIIIFHATQPVLTDLWIWYAWKWYPIIFAYFYYPILQTLLEISF